jgi:hypothetical protein
MFYEMLNKKVTEPYKVSEIDGRFKEHMPHHFEPKKPEIKYDKEPMGYAGIID